MQFVSFVVGELLQYCINVLNRGIKYFYSNQCFNIQQIDHQTDYHTFKKKWGHDVRFMALDRKEREALLNERYK